MLQVALTIFTGILIASISSWITVQLSLGKFRTEKWWERKVEAYTKTIESLHNLKAFTGNNLEAMEEGREITEEANKELRQRSKIAHIEIAKCIDTGAFLLSEDALSRLKKYQKDAKHASQSTSWYEHLESDWVATNSCLEEIIILAKKDLQAK